MDLASVVLVRISLRKALVIVGTNSPLFFSNELLLLTGGANPTCCRVQSLAPRKCPILWKAHSSLLHFFARSHRPAQMNWRNQIMPFYSEDGAIFFSRPSWRCTNDTSDRARGSRQFSFTQLLGMLWIGPDFDLRPRLRGFSGHVKVAIVPICVHV